MKKIIICLLFFMFFLCSTAIAKTHTFDEYYAYANQMFTYLNRYGGYFNDAAQQQCMYDLALILYKEKADLVPLTKELNKKMDEYVKEYQATHK